MLRQQQEIEEEIERLHKEITSCARKNFPCIICAQNKKMIWTLQWVLCLREKPTNH